jgi:hypothetical protein
MSVANLDLVEQGGVEELASSVAGSSRQHFSSGLPMMRLRSG